MPISTYEEIYAHSRRTPRISGRGRPRTSWRLSAAHGANVLFTGPTAFRGKSFEGR